MYASELAQRSWRVSRWGQMESEMEKEGGEVIPWQGAMDCGRVYYLYHIVIKFRVRRTVTCRCMVPFLQFFTLLTGRYGWGGERIGEMGTGYCGGCLVRSKALSVKDVNIQRMDATVSECRLDELRRDGFLLSLHIYWHKIRFVNSAIMFSHKLICHISKFGLE